MTLSPCPNPECRAACEVKSYPSPYYRVECTEKYCYIGPAGNTKDAAIRKHNGIYHSNDPMLAEALREIEKYKTTIPSASLLFMVLP